MRRAVRTALGSLTLLSPDRNQRLRAAQSVLQSADPTRLAPSRMRWLPRRTEPFVRSSNRRAPTMLLFSDRPVEERRKAVRLLEESGGREALPILSAALGSATKA
ncbi:hypothetical protein F2981_24865 (plasmid) [Sinorhizobium meliloti]|nr:hypothetical protein [Sinorhizobium meliloti]